MKTAVVPFQPSVLLAPVRTLEFKIAGVPVRVPWSTPVRWRLILGAVLLTGLLFALAVRSAVTQGREAFKSIASDCAPSIIDAQHIQSSLADLDANLTNQLLCAPGSPDLAKAVAGATARRREFTENLVQAVAHITFGDAERQPILTMANELGTYETAMSRALALQEKGDANGALAASREASRRMHEVVLPAAAALDRVNSQVLDRTYDLQQARFHWALGCLIAAGLLCLGTQAGAQWLLWRGTRRWINPGLLAGSILTTMFLIYGVEASCQSSEKLRQTTKDAFDSVRYLWKATAVAYDANGAESRWLHDHAQAATHEKAFFDEAAEVGEPPPGTRLQEMAAYALAHPKHPVQDGFKGLLANELGNITFPGELEAAAAATQSFGDYLDVDKEIRRLERAGQHAQAVALCLSYGPGGSNAAFARFDAALSRVREINVDYFERYKKEGTQGLAPFDWLIPAFALAAAGCALAGFWPRLNEYRG